MHTLIVASLLALGIPGIQMAVAGEFSSPWQDNPSARARLITTGFPDAENRTRSLSAGVQIELDPKWKTYWRFPGGSGIPIQTKWDGSTNVKSIKVRWPAPHRFINEYGMTIGYKNEVVLPVEIVPKDINAPVQLKLELNYGVCLDICLPVTSNMMLEIKPKNQSASPFKRKLERFVKKVPKSSTPSQGFRVKKLGISGEAEQVILSLAVENPGGEGLVDVFVEGDETLFFDTPTKIISKGAVSQVEVPVFGVKSAKALNGKKLRFTLVGKKSSADQYWTIGG